MADPLAEFDRIAASITGIVLGARDRDRRARALEDAWVAAGRPRWAEYLAAMADGAAGRETVESILGPLTVKETYFFRTPAHFEALQDVVLPDVQASRSVGWDLFSRRALRIWSAGCATGQETYSISMAVVEALKLRQAWDLLVLGTDLDSGAVQVSRDGRYSGVRLPARATRLESLTERHLVDRGDGVREVDAEIRGITSFGRHNLFADEAPADLDVVFCRNVMIYFPFARQQELIDRLYAALRPGGWLFTGEAEMLHIVRHEFETVQLPGTVAYRKPGGAPFGRVA